MVVHEHLADVEHGFLSRALFYGLEPCPDACPQGLFASHLANLRGQGLYIQHGREVALLHLRVAQKPVGLFPGGRGGREEVVGSHGNAPPACLLIVVGIVFVEHRDAFGRLDVEERYGVVHLASDTLAAEGSQMGDAQFVPVDGVVLLADVVLES